MGELPHFLGIGAQKSATSWLDRCLRRHPGLWLPPIKELHYFTHRSQDTHSGAAGRAFGRDWVNRQLRGTLRSRLRADLRYLDVAGLRWDLRYFFGARTDDWYASLFRLAGGRTAGEIDPEYSTLSAEEVGIVRESFSHLKLIYIMRDPIDRAWSQMRMIGKRRGWSLGAISDGAALELVRDPRVLSRGSYRATLDNWGLHFPAERFFVAFLEDVRSNPRGLLLDLFRFLDVEARDSFLPPDLMRPVHRGEPLSIPPVVEKELAGIYVEELRLLEERFGSPMRAWRERAERALES